MSADSPDQPCYCGRDSSFADCCRPIITGEQQAERAEDLMRSRYSAYVVGEVEFIARYKIAGRGHRLHERSRFGRHSGRWVSLDGHATSKHR